MPSYSEDWNPFPKLTPKFQLKVTRLAALGCLLSLATEIAILTWVDSSRTYCPGWVIDKNNDTIWKLVWFFGLPPAAFWCWRAVFMTERKILTETQGKYQKGPPYPMTEDINLGTPEEFRTVDFDTSIWVGAVAFGLVCAIPLFFMLALCSPLAPLWRSAPVQRPGVNLHRSSGVPALPVTRTGEGEGVAPWVSSACCSSWSSSSAATGFIMSMPPASPMTRSAPPSIPAFPNRPANSPAPS